MTFPQIILQSTTTQNDLVATFFFISTLYFLFLDLKIEGQTLILSGIALGLAVGTKATILLVLPGLAVAVLVIGLLTGKPGFRGLGPDMGVFLAFWGRVFGGVYICSEPGLIMGILSAYQSGLPVSLVMVHRRVHELLWNYQAHYLF